MAEVRPIVASYCATFLKPEMLHIYRQIAGLTRWQSAVVTSKQENVQRFSVEGLADSSPQPVSVDQADMATANITTPV